MSSNLVALTLGLGLSFWVLISLQGVQKSALPAMLHNCSWMVALLTIGTGLIAYKPLSMYVWVLIAGAIFAFNFGISLACKTPRPPSISKPVAGPLATRFQYRFLLIAFTLGLFVYLITIARLYGVGTLLSNPASIRADSTKNYLEVFPLYGKILFYLGPTCLILTLFPEYVEGSQRLALRAPLVVLLVAAQLVTLQRTNLFVCLLWFSGLIILRIQSTFPSRSLRRVTRKQVVALVISVCVGLVVFQGIAVALGKTGSNIAAINSATDGTVKGSPIASALYYSSSGVAAFGILVESADERWPADKSIGLVYGAYNPQTWGKATFSGPLKLIPGIQHWNEVAAFVKTPGPTNVFTWLEPWYRDFRAPGVVFGSLAMGLIIGSFSRRAGSTPELTLLAGFLLGLSGLASFLNRYMFVMTVVIYSTIWILGRLRNHRDSQRLSSSRPASAKRIVS